MAGCKRGWAAGVAHLHPSPRLRCRASGAAQHAVGRRQASSARLAPNSNPLRHASPTCSTLARRVIPSTCSWSCSSLSRGSADSDSARACRKRLLPLALPAEPPPARPHDAAH
jgi:hypothetical protein